MKAIVGIFSLVLSLQVSAGDEKSLIDNLESRIHNLPNGKGSLIKSYTDHSQSYIYDQALAVIAFSHAQDQINAERLLDGLDYLQNEDGSLYFSYNLEGKSSYPKNGDKRFAGAIAWVALSLGHYQQAFDSKKYQSFNKRLFAYLQKEMLPVTTKGQKALAIRFNPTDISTTKWAETETLALEHNLDLYAAFHFDQRVNKTNWSKEITGLKAFILGMWDMQRSHFWSGANAKTGIINQDELYLDNQTWSLLALDKNVMREIDFSAALSMNCEIFLGKHNGVIGFKDHQTVRGPSSEHFVWSEGSLGQIMAIKKFEKLQKKDFNCAGKKSDELLNSLLKLKKEDGGVGYATSENHPDFTNSSSVAGTAWMYFAKVSYNPFSSH